MELETMHDREFYEAKAKDYPLLEQVIRGETSFTGHIDSIFQQMARDRKTNSEAYVLVASFSIDKGPLEDFATCLETIVELSDHHGPLEDIREAMRNYWDVKSGKDFKKVWLTGNLGMYGLAAIVYAGLFLFVPGGALLELGLMLAGGGGIRAWAKKLKKNRAAVESTKRKCDTVLSPIYEAAEQLDHEIATFFAAEHFDSARNQFERTYPLLSDGQREQVDTQLYGLLGVGGMKNMDEIQLGDYLSGLLEQRASGDA